MATVLVTGRNGFVGRALIQELKPRHKIISIVRRLRNGVDYSGEALVQADVRSLSAEQVGAWRPEWIIHLAAEIRGRPHRIRESNVQGARNVFAIASHMGLPVFFMSSTNVLFADALGPYASSKRICEEALKSAGIPYLTIRTPLILGKESPALQALREAERKLAFLPLFGLQEGKVQPIPVRSLVNFIAAELDVAPGSEVVHLVGRRSYTYREIITHALGQQNQPRFLVLPCKPALALVSLLERLRLPSPISVEMVRSMNMDKIISGDTLENVHWVDNAWESLFN